MLELEFKTIIDAADNQPISINPYQVETVFKYNDAESTCILIEPATAFSKGYRIAVNAKREDVIAYLEGKTEELKYFSNNAEEDANPAEEEQHEVPLYRVLINCRTVASVHCAINIMVKHGIVEDNPCSKAEAVRDIMIPLGEDNDTWVTVKEGITLSEANELNNDFINTTCINSKIVQM